MEFLRFCKYATDYICYNKFNDKYQASTSQKHKIVLQF